MINDDGDKGGDDCVDQASCQFFFWEKYPDQLFRKEKWRFSRCSDFVRGARCKQHRAAAEASRFVWI